MADERAAGEPQGTGGLGAIVVEQQSPLVRLQNFRPLELPRTGGKELGKVPHAAPRTYGLIRARLGSDLRIDPWRHRQSVRPVHRQDDGQDGTGTFETKDQGSDTQFVKGADFPFREVVRPPACSTFCSTCLSAPAGSASAEAAHVALYFWISPSHIPRAFNNPSITSRTAPQPPPAVVI